jgi:hypothetical protein
VRRARDRGPWSTGGVFGSSERRRRPIRDDGQRSGRGCFPIRPRPPRRPHALDEDARHRGIDAGRLRLSGITSWRSVSAGRGRFFIEQPGQPPNRGHLDFHVNENVQRPHQPPVEPRTAVYPVAEVSRFKIVHASRIAHAVAGSGYNASHSCLVGGSAARRFPEKRWISVCHANVAGDSP